MFKHIAIFMIMLGVSASLQAMENDSSKQLSKLCELLPSNVLTSDQVDKVSENCRIPGLIDLDLFLNSGEAYLSKLEMPFFNLYNNIKTIQQVPQSETASIVYKFNYSHPKPPKPPKLPKKYSFHFMEINGQGNNRIKLSKKGKKIDSQVNLLPNAVNSKEDIFINYVSSEMQKKSDKMSLKHILN